MPLPVKDTGGGDFKIPEQGTHLANCIMVAHLGLQPSSNPAYKPRDQILIQWELPNERREWEEDGEKKSAPLVVMNTYTASLSPKSYLRKDLEGWRAKAFTEEELRGFDVMKVLGKPCMLNIIHNESNGKTYANVIGISALPKGMEAVALENKPLKYCEGEEADFDNLPEWIQKKIKNRINPEPVEHRTSANEDFDDDIPF